MKLPQLEPMRQYRIDELRPKQYEQIRDYLDAHYGPSHMEGLYWIPLEEDLLDEVQAAHHDCRPFWFALELRPHSVSVELLVRTRNRVRCDCIRYANAAQRESIIRFADTMFETLKILT